MTLHTRLLVPFFMLVSTTSAHAVELPKGSFALFDCKTYIVLNGIEHPTVLFKQPQQKINVTLNISEERQLTIDTKILRPAFYLPRGESVDSRSVVATATKLVDLEHLRDDSFLFWSEGLATSISEGNTTTYPLEVMSVRFAPNSFGRFTMISKNGEEILAQDFAPACRLQNRDLLAKVLTLFGR